MFPKIYPTVPLVIVYMYGLAALLVKIEEKEKSLLMLTCNCNYILSACKAKLHFEKKSQINLRFSN